MILNKNKNKIAKKFVEGQLDEIHVIFPNIADKALTQIDSDYKLDDILSEVIDLKRHADALNPVVFIYSLISAKLKRLFSISESIVALTSVKLLEKFNINIHSKKEIMSEGNMRDFINKFSETEEIREEQIEKRRKEIEEKNKNIKNEDKKITINREEIKKDLQIEQNGHKWIELFNDTMEKLIDKIPVDNKKEPVIHILDCVKIPVNTSNKNYELSTIINYEGKPIRGYKLGALRRLTDFGGVFEYLIDGTISTNDISLTETQITNYNGFKEGDILMMDRGFAKIEFIINLVKRNIKVIIPVKKNMDIYKESVKIAKETSNDLWEKHPNSKREGQDILLVKDLKGTWISEKDRNKKPEKIMDNAIEFSACVVRIEKKNKKNKDIIKAAKNAGDDIDELYEDDKYLYIVITTTDTSMSAADIIRYYELRPEIEEDFRQLKDIWKMCTFTSTKYNFVMAQLTMTILGYNIFNLFKNTKEGEKYINKSMRKIENEEKRLTVAFNETHYFIIYGNTYGIFNGIELLDLYADSPKEIREKIKPLLSY